MRKFILVIVGILALADAAPDCSPGSRSRYKALVCWLWNSKITLPNQQFRDQVFTINVNEMTCTNFEVSSMKTSSTPSSGTAPNPSIQMDLNQISAKCTGKYHVDDLNMSGDIVASVAGNAGTSSLHLQLDIASKPLQEQKSTNNTKPANDDDKSALPFPSSATFSSCKPNFVVHDLQFSGSASAHVIDLFHGVISKAVTKAMNGHVCELIKKNGESILDRSFHAAREYIGGLILNSTLVRESGHVSHKALEQIALDSAKQADRLLLNDDNAVTWDDDMPFLKQILLGVNDFVSRHLNDGIILKFMQKLSTWQSMTTADCEDCGFFYKGFNGLVNLLTKGAGSFEVSIPDQFLNFHHNHTFNISHLGQVVLTAHKLKVSGINNLTDIALFRPEGQSMLSSTLASDTGFDVTMLLDLEIRPADSKIFHGETLNETFELHFNVSNVDFKSSSAWYLDPDVFSKLSVGSFIYGSYSVFDNNRNILTCVIEALQSFIIHDLQGRVHLDAMKVSPFVPAYEFELGDNASLEADIDTLINNVMQLLLSEYPTTTTEVLAGIIQTPLRNMLNDGFEHLISSTKEMPLHCVNVDFPTNKSANPLRLDSNKALVFFDHVVNDESAIEAINSFIDCIDNTLETKKLFAGHFYNFSLGELNVVLRDLHFENTNSVYELQLLKPEIDHYHLTNSFGYGMCTSTTDVKDCNTTSFSFGMNLAHDRQGNLGSINVSISMKNLKLQGGTEIELDMNYLPFLQLSDVLAKLQCLTVPLTSFDFYGLNATVEMLEVKIDVSLSSQNGIPPRSFTYNTKDSSELGAVVSALMSKSSVLLQEALGNGFAVQLDEASNMCETPANPHRTYETNRSTALAGLWTFLIVVGFIAGNAWLFLRGFDSDNLLGTTVHVQPDEQQEPSLNESLLSGHDEMDEKLEVETPLPKMPFASSSSLMYHPTIHPALKFGFPAILLLAFILFLSSNLTVGASVDLLVTRANGNNLTSLINIYSFSLGSTLREMVQAGVYLLMLLILFCSGIWPYIKLVLMMVSWVASTRRLPPIKREKILYYLDSLGKFSLIDAYVLVLMMVAFRYELEVEGVGTLNVYVTPKYGFYSFLFATIMSLISGHCMLFLHRRTMLPYIPVFSGRYEALGKHIFDDKRNNRGLVRLTKRFRRTIVFALFLALVLICVGAGLKSFHFVFSGVAGTALGEDNSRAFSLVSIGEHIPQSVNDSSSFGIHWITLCYIFFALIMPIVCLLALLVLFIVPMRLKMQQFVFLVAEVTNAWSAVEVFVIAILASLIEISPFSESMVGSHCSLLNKILSGFSGGEGDDLHYCFDVKSSIDGSSAVLIIGVILNSLLVSTLHRLAHHAIWERIEREDRPDATQEENDTVRDCVFAHIFVHKLRQRRRLGRFMFEDVSFGPQMEYEIDFENVADEEPHTSNNFWSEWKKIVSVI